MNSKIPTEPDAVPLAQLSTIWTTVLQAHGGPVVAEQDAQRRFFEHYQGAIYRYFRTAVRDPDAAGELFQQLALRFLRGDFRKFDPAKGRFRDYLKTALANLIRDYHKQDRRTSTVEATTEPQKQPDVVPDINECCRTELLRAVWESLKDFDIYHSVLLFRVKHPKVTAEKMAEDLNRQLSPKRPFTVTGIRKTLQRARERFADVLLSQVEGTLDHPDLATLEQELIELDLLSYCRAALDRRWVLES